MPQMSPSWWLILFIFIIKSFFMLMSMIYFQWMPLLSNKMLTMKMMKKFNYNDKNF